MLPLLALFATTSVLAQYYPERNNWEVHDAAQHGLDGVLLDSAVAFAMSNEYSGPHDLRRAILKGFEREPFHEILGPTKKRGGPSGVIIKDGYIVAEWGEPQRVDMTFSVTKSYLSTVAGLAVDAGIIKKTDDRVIDYVWDGTFRGDHNGKITWSNLLDQSSDWSGELFGTRDWADRPPREGDLDQWKMRPMQKPGTVFEYNDVRVNVLAYSLLQVWRKPLPSVLKEQVMDPIGCSTTWRWFGYDNSWVDVDGVKVQSVSGGGHSGGGLFINTLDHARFGLLMCRDGVWNEQRIISSSWIDTATQPSSANESYGYMWWLNAGERELQGVPEEIFYAAGFGGNYIVVNQAEDLVIVTRWLEPSQMAEMTRLVHAAIK